jgi:endonuclease/exonuclease/phosphatase family metal-dependent hydrolase
MRILSCNIRYSGATTDGDNHWSFRKQICLDVIRSRQADVICCQEVKADQFAFLAAGLPEYASFGITDRPQSLDPANAMFYRRDACRLVAAGGYWLSDTPHVPGSKSWQSAVVRLCNWLRLVELSSGKELRVVNTHLDHISQLARANQARLINEDAAAYEAGYPQVLAGDMNADYANPAVQSYLAAGWQDTYSPMHPGAPWPATFHAFMGPDCDRTEGKIDWIMVRGAVHVLGAEVITDVVNGRYPSDHYFLSADVAL